MNKKFTNFNTLKSTKNHKSQKRANFKTLKTTKSHNLQKWANFKALKTTKNHESQKWASYNTTKKPTKNQQICLIKTNVNKTWPSFTPHKNCELEGKVSQGAPLYTTKNNKIEK